MGVFRWTVCGHRVGGGLEIEAISRTSFIYAPSVILDVCIAHIDNVCRKDDLQIELKSSANSLNLLLAKKCSLEDHFKNIKSAFTSFDFIDDIDSVIEAFNQIQSAAANL